MKVNRKNTLLCKEVALSPRREYLPRFAHLQAGLLQNTHVKEIQGSDYQTIHIKCRCTWKRVNMAFGMVPNSLDEWGKCVYPPSLYTPIIKVKVKVRSTHWTVIPGCIVFATINQDSSRFECHNPQVGPDFEGSGRQLSDVSNFGHFHCKAQGFIKAFDLFMTRDGKGNCMPRRFLSLKDPKDKSQQIWPIKCDRDNSKIECMTQFS